MNKISIILPFKENFSPTYAGAVSLHVEHISQNSKYKKNIHVYGSTKFKKKFKYIVCVSRFTKRKGIQELIISFCEALKINKNLKLILVGYGDEEKNIINLIQQK